MPSTMIHLLVARELRPEAPGLYWVGNFAPDSVDERLRKDEIHLRTVPDRTAALAQLRKTLDLENLSKRAGCCTSIPICAGTPLSFLRFRSSMMCRAPSRTGFSGTGRSWDWRVIICTIKSLGPPVSSNRSGIPMCLRSPPRCPSRPRKSKGTATGFASGIRKATRRRYQRRSARS